jgi:hypothetical protein
MAQIAALRNRVESGNAGAVETCGTGWFVGFSEWSKQGTGLRHIAHDVPSTELCVKWFVHQPGDPNGQGKPLSAGRTLSILAGSPGDFRIEFSLDPGFTPGTTLLHDLRSPGDFVIWGEGLYHRWACVESSCILTVRWTPQS